MSEFNVSAALDRISDTCGSHPQYQLDFRTCLQLPNFLNQTNGTGCCADGFTGVCGGCGSSFYCPKKVEASFSWGIILAVLADIAISVGLALQKAAHKIVDRRVTELSRKSVESGGSGDV